MNTPAPIPKTAPTVTPKARKKETPGAPTPNASKTPVGPVPGQETLATLLALKPFTTAAVPGLFPGLSDEEVVIFVESKTETEARTIMVVQVSYYGIALGKHHITKTEKGLLKWT